MNKQIANLLAMLIVSIAVTSLISGKQVRAQDIDSSTNTPIAPDSSGVGFTESELASMLEGDGTLNIGHRTEDPGQFLRWPLPSSVPYTNITLIPDSPWTENLLGISNCPKYPPMIDTYSWGGWTYPGQFANYALPGTSKDRVRFKNVDDSGLFHNFFACYRATAASESHQNVSLPDHAGTDISAANNTNVLAAAYADEIYVIVDDEGDYRIRLRHPNVNGTGQTWYTYYVHLSGSSYPMGTTRPAGGLSGGSVIGKVGSYHLHFQAGVTPDYSNSGSRNLWGIDQSPWTGCLWLDSSLCPIPPTGSGCCGCGSRTTSSEDPSGNGLFSILGPPAPEISLIMDPMIFADEASIPWQGPESSKALRTEPNWLGEPEIEGAIDRSSPFVAFSQNNTNVEFLQTKAFVPKESEFELPASANYQIVRSVQGMGGGPKTSSSYTLFGTSGQPFATGLRTSTNYRLSSGYWGASADFAISTPTPTVAAPVTNTPTSTATATASPSATATATVIGTAPPVDTPTSTPKPTATSTAESPTATATRPANLDFSLHLPVIMRD